MQVLSISLPILGFILILLGVFCIAFTGGMMFIKAALDFDPAIPVPDKKRKLKAGPAKIIKAEVVVDEYEAAIS